MSRASIVTCALLALSGALVVSQSAGAAPATLTAAEIVDKNVTARGGLTAWRGIQTLSWSGKLEAGGNHQRALKIPGIALPPPSAEPAAQVQLPFVFEMMRGHKSRFEIEFAGQTAIQVYDGAQGWKLRPFLNRLEVEPFTAAELQATEMQSDLDGALIDYASKGTTVELAGVESIEGRDAYKLKLTLKNGHVVHNWIDTVSFLEVKIEGTPRKLDGKYHPVSIFLRDYRSVNGLRIPHLIETMVQGVERTEKIQIENVVVNPNLEESRFTKPTV